MFTKKASFIPCNLLLLVSDSKRYVPNNNLPLCHKFQNLISQPSTPFTKRHIESIERLLIPAAAHIICYVCQMQKIKTHITTNKIRYWNDYYNKSTETECIAQLRNHVLQYIYGMYDALIILLAVNNYCSECLYEDIHYIYK